jgi:hypothetical protein
MSNHLLNQAWKASTGSSTNKVVLCFLADKANDKKGGKVWYSIGAIQKHCDISKPSVNRALITLKRQGHVSWSSGKGRWKTNLYTVHPVVTETEVKGGDDAQNMTPVSPFNEEEDEFNSITQIPLTDSNGITESLQWDHSEPSIVSHGYTNGISLIHLNQTEPKQNPNSTQPPAPIESASAYSHSTEGEDDDELPLSHVSSEKKKKTGAQKEKGWQPDEYQKVINRWFKRRDWTAWSAKELEAYRAIDEQTIIDGIEDLNAYYSASKEVAPYKRRGILTLLNNWSGDMDKWAEWSAPSAQAELMRRGLGNRCSVSGY